MIKMSFLDTLFPSRRGRGYGHLIGNAVRRPRSMATCLLETVPPVFHLALIGSLAYHAIILNPYSNFWPLATFFVVAQIVSNWGFFLANKSIVLASPKNFPGYQHRYPSLTSNKGFKETAAEVAEINYEWKECESCDMHVPLRTHHCGHCR